jgi:hypothetical protein
MIDHWLEDGLTPFLPTESAASVSAALMPRLQPLPSVVLFGRICVENYVSHRNSSDLERGEASAHYTARYYAMCRQILYLVSGIKHRLG